MLKHALRRRLATDPGSPLFIHYDGALGSRIELSGLTFANWVDKTVNLIDTLGVEPRSVIRLELAASHPGHWVTAVWTTAAWQWGCTVTLDAAESADLIVGGPTVTAAPAAPTVACSLHPLGLPLAAVPLGCSDYSEVFGEPDAHQSAEATPEALAWSPSITFAELTAVPASAERSLLTDPRPGWDTVARMLLAPLLGGGSTVVITTSTPELVAQVRRDERISP